MDVETLLTKEGAQKLKDELKYREGELRKKLQDTLNQMRSQGDLKENDGYTMAVDDFQDNETKILHIRETLEKATIIQKKDTSVVNLGSLVTIKCEKGLLRKYSIVGENEANPMEAKISYKSPLGSSLFGKKKGSTITIETPSGSDTCKIISIE